MITTKMDPSALGISITDSTVYVNAGVTQIGNSVMAFQGGSTTFSRMTNFSGTANRYQYSALMLSKTVQADNVGSWVDMTAATSVEATSQTAVLFPVADSTNLSPVGLFMFKKTSSGIDLLSYDKVI